MGGLARSCGAVILLAIVGSCRGVTLESVHWSSSNAKFTPGQGLVLYPQIGDKMDIVCPRADPSSAGTEEFYKVYLVTKSQMESCGVDKTDTPLLNCDKPEQDVKFTFKFQEFSPNLWGLEFLKGRDYYITYSSDPLLTLQESPTRFPPAPPKTKTKDVFTKDLGSEAGQAISSGPGLAVWVISGCSIVLLLIAGVLVALWRYHRRRRVPDRRQQQRQPPASVSLSTLAVPKRDSISSDNGGSDRSEVAFPLRASESMICRHYERGSGEYGPPVYIVQEIMPQSPTNVYYKV
ncbi:ephrin-B2a isoform X3 [Fundulus heteroclitus]|uniref:ephrin-B2a isoform X3 n=1 Tax=Fundulus heteroclitus TaxID=8078 RepID=UPI00165A1AED|nr:ephrin-B2a isoform X3 [Fundulus heteroclitus]